MDLLLDIGNSYTTVGVHENGNFTLWRLGPSSFDSEDVLFANLLTLSTYANLNLSEISKVGVSSVVPKNNFIVDKFALKYLKIEPIFVSSDKKVNNIAYLVDYPKQVGADRISNVIASKKDYGDDVIAIDFGTAITVDILENGNFIGGAIIPGFNTAINSLFSKTANLPQVEITLLDYNIGKNTIDNIQIGTIKTILFGLDRLINEIKSERKKNFYVVTTGGDAKFLSNKFFSYDKYDPYLTLKGILYYLEEIKK
jgi:type III pantothenate kinase